jgi:hypothetical protein
LPLPNCGSFEFLPAEGAKKDLEFTIVRPFSWIGPRMDFIPGIDGPSKGIPGLEYVNYGYVLLAIRCQYLCVLYSNYLESAAASS